MKRGAFNVIAVVLAVLVIVAGLPVADRQKRGGQRRRRGDHRHGQDEDRRRQCREPHAG